MKSPFWNKTLTVYTKYFDEETKTATWYRYVLTDCFFARTNKARFASPELYRESENLARIPAQENYVPYEITAQAYVMNGSYADSDMSDVLIFTKSKPKLAAPVIVLTIPAHGSGENAGGGTIK